MSLEYKILRKPRRKNLSITITSNNQIVVKANNSIADKEIGAFLESKAAWIRKTMEFNRNVKTPYTPKEFVNGESFLCLGKEYQLILHKKSIQEIFLKEKTLDVFAPERYMRDQEYVRKKLILWYKCTAYEVIFKRVALYKQILNVKVTEIMIRSLKRTWGNCSSRGVVTFSWRLLMAPIDIIDYVVVHELCHRIHHNHSVLFWQAVEEVLPNYKGHKKWLKVNENTFLW